MDEQTTIESLSFEESYRRLEEVIRQLESSQLTLQESLALYEEGIMLARHCERQLDEAELRVTQLLEETTEALGDQPDALEDTVTG